MKNNQSFFYRWLLPGLISLIAALVLTFFSAPFIASMFDVPLPPWLTVQGISDIVLNQGGVSEENPTLEVAPEDWPAPPESILAASKGVTDTVASATRVVPPTATPRPTPTILALPTPSWSDMNHLTSVKFTAATIVEAERGTTIAILGDITTDRILLKAVGNILVGIDLEKISNVVVDGSSIRVSLPSPEIISVEILPKESQIYDSSKTIFLSQYDGLENEALEKARQQLRIEILQNQGLMELARDKSRLQLTEFLESVGFGEVKIDFPYLESQDRG